MNAGELRHVVVSANGRRGLVQRSGFVREADLQTLVLSSPDLLGPLGAGLKFLPIGWEVPVGPGALDLLFVDSEGILTLVETKLRANNESRRQVIGQVLEYASYAAEWSPTDIRAIAERFFASDHAPPELRGATLDAALIQTFGWEEGSQEEQEAYVATLMARLEASVSAGNLRVVCGVDERIESLERLVNYFSAHSDLAVVLLQVNRFVVDEHTFVLVPTIHGTVTESTPRTRNTYVPMTHTSLLDSFENDAERQCVNEFLTAASECGASFEYGSTGVSIRTRTRLHPFPVTVAWVFPPGKWGWMRTKEISLGHGLDSDTVNVQLRSVVDSYYERLVSLPFGGDASSKGVKAKWFSPSELLQNQSAITGLLTQAIREVSGAIPDE